MTLQGVQWGSKVRFNPIDPDGLSDRELLEKAVLGINDVHYCVDDFRSSQAHVNEALAEAIGSVQTVQTMANGRIEKLTKLFGAEPWAPGERKIRPRAIGLWPGWKAAAAGMGVVGGGVTAFQILAHPTGRFVVDLYHAVMAYH